TDDHTTKLTAALNRVGFNEVGRDTIRHVLQSVAMPNRYHPVREYLESQKWDGVSRLGVGLKGESQGSCWLTTYFGCIDNEHSRKAGTWWMVQAVRRIFKPGSFAKYVLTLEGLQDKGKSTALGILTGAQWFSETEMKFDTNGMLALAGV